MTTLLCYSRNRSTSVEQIDDDTLVSTCTLQDNLTEAFVRIRIRFPELKILQAEGKFIRSGQDACIHATTAFERIKGVRIGPGMKKIIRGLTGEKTACKELPFLIEECCHGVILAFTKDALALAPKEEMLSTDFFKTMVQENIRLYNSCAAFTPPSSLVEGLDL